MRAARLRDVRKKLTSETQKGDVIVFAYHDNPSLALVGIVVQRITTDKVNTLLCNDAYTGCLFERRISGQYVDVLQERAVTFEALIAEMNYKNSKLTYDRENRVYRNAHYGVLADRIDEEWRVWKDGRFLGAVRSPSDLGYLVDENGLFVSNKASDEFYWFEADPELPNQTK